MPEVDRTTPRTSGPGGESKRTAASRQRPLAERVRPLLSQELGRLAEQFADADARARRAEALGDRGDYDAADAERQAANAEFLVASATLGELFLLLLRNARQHQPKALRSYLADALRDELQPILEAVVRLEAKR